MADREWPNLVGKAGDEAKASILKGNPNLQVDIVPDGSMVTMDYREDRVRIFVDASGVVSKVPKID